VEAEQPDYQDVVDQALQLVYSHHHRLMTQLSPAAFVSLTLDQLRTGPLGQDLMRLAELAKGQRRENKEDVLSAIESVLQLLFWPIAAEDYTVPRSFWDTELGRMLRWRNTARTIRTNSSASARRRSNSASPGRRFTAGWMTGRSITSATT
jgi:hypothetical protein